MPESSRARARATALAAVLLLVSAACTGEGAVASTATNTTGASGSSVSSASAPSAPLTRLDRAKTHLKHLIFIVQENRSFDHYFGTFPGAEGIPMRNGEPTVCVPDTILGECVSPYHTDSQLQEGGPHAQPDSRNDVNGGRMDGFVQTVVNGPQYCADHRGDPSCASYLGPQGQPDVMSYMTKREIPNYWTYARRFVLQDHLFAPADSWTLPAHLFLVSAWAARCADPRDPMSCSSDLALYEEAEVQKSREDVPIWAWTDITYLLHEQDVSWSYYVGDDTCFFDPCSRGGPGRRTVMQQMPLPWFTTIRHNHQLRNIRGHADYYEAASEGTLPSVSWVVPVQRRW